MAELIAHACYGIDIGGTKIELVACDAAMQVTGAAAWPPTG